MHPDVLDPELGALAHRLVGDLGPRADYNRADAAGNRVEVAVRTIALDLVGVRIDCENVVAAFAQARVDSVAAVTSGVRETPVTATRFWARNSDAASLIGVIETSLTRAIQSRTR